MPRTLAVRHTEVDPAERAAFVGRLPGRRDHFRDAGCRYWVFEEARRGGSFIEFIEATDAAAVEAALAGAPEPVTGARVYHELGID